MARAVQYSKTGGPEVLEINDVPDPVAGPGLLTIRVEAAGINPIDAKLRNGTRPSGPFDGPRGIGGDGAGTVTAVGEGVDGFRVGDPVVFFGVQGREVGSYATDIAVESERVTVRPAGVSAAHAAALPIPAGTAYQALRSLAVRLDDTLLIHGGSGAVGQAAIQYAVLLGAHVIASTSEARADRVAALGAEPVPYGDGLVDAVRELAPQGVTVILDCAGTDQALAQSLELLDDRSRIATIVRGADAGDLGIRAFSGGSPEPLTAQQLAWREKAVPYALGGLASGQFTVEIGETFSLEQAADAHRALEAGAQGKLLLLPDAA